MEPRKSPRPATVEDTLETFQQIVGGPYPLAVWLDELLLTAAALG